MIKINLIAAIAMVISFSLILVFVWQVFYNYPWKKLSTDESLEQCPFCTHVFYLYMNKGSIWVCPQCKSLVQKEEANIERKVIRG